MKLTTSLRKKFRVGNKVKKVAKVGRFRLSISRSSKNISAQIIDDIKQTTLKLSNTSHIDSNNDPSNKSIWTENSSFFKPGFYKKFSSKSLVFTKFQLSKTGFFQNFSFFKMVFEQIGFWSMKMDIVGFGKFDFDGRFGWKWHFLRDRFKKIGLVGRSFFPIFVGGWQKEN